MKLFNTAEAPSLFIIPAFHFLDSQQRKQHIRWYIRLRQFCFVELLIHSPLAQGAPEKQSLITVHHQVVQRSGTDQVFTGGIQECDPLPLLAGDGPRQLFQRADLDLVILLPGAGMIRFILQQLAAGVSSWPWTGAMNSIFPPRSPKEDGW